MARLLNNLLSLGFLSLCTFSISFAQKGLVSVYDLNGKLLNFEQTLVVPMSVKKISIHCSPINGSNYLLSKTGKRINIIVPEFVKKFNLLECIEIDCGSTFNIDFAHFPKLATIFFSYGSYDKMPVSLAETSIETIKFRDKGRVLTLHLNPDFIKYYAGRRIVDVFRDTSVTFATIKRTEEWQMAENLGYQLCRLPIDTLRVGHVINNSLDPCLSSNPWMSYLEVGLNEIPFDSLQNLDISPNQKNIMILIHDKSKVDYKRFMVLKSVLQSKNINVEIK